MSGIFDHLVELPIVPVVQGLRHVLAILLADAIATARNGECWADCAAHA